MTISSTISAGTTIVGTIESDVDLDISGRVEGSISVSGELLVGPTALLQSNITAQRITVRGAVAGNLTADEFIVLEEGARVVGDIIAPRVGVRPGALLRGNVSTEGAGAGPQKAKATPAARPAPPRAAAAPVRAAAPAPARPAPVRAAPAAAPPARPEPEVVSVKAAPAAAPVPPAREASEPPPPVLPTLNKGAKGQLRKRGGR